MLAVLSLGENGAVVSADITQIQISDILAHHWRYYGDLHEGRTGPNQREVRRVLSVAGDIYQPILPRIAPIGESH